MSRRLLMIAITVFCILLAGVFISSDFIYRNGKTNVNISISSPDAYLTINSVVVKTNNIYLQPGKYLISANKKGYFENRKIYEINEKEMNMHLKLTPIPDKTVSELNFDGDFNKLQAKYPIIKNFPYDAGVYLIDYDIKGSYLKGYSIELLVMSDNAIGRREALRGIRDLGYNPIDYSVKFENFESEIK